MLHINCSGTLFNAFRSLLCKILIFEDMLYKLINQINIQGHLESNAIRFLFMTLSLKGTQIMHHKKVYSMSIS